MKKSLMLLFLILLISMLMGCVQDDKSPNVQLTGMVFPTSLPTTEVEWFLLPGGNMASLDVENYYVEVDMINNGHEIIDLPGVEAYFSRDGGDILLIRVVKTGKLAPGSKATFHLVTDGYTPYMLQKRNESINLTVSLKWNEGKVVLSSATTLPSFAEFNRYDEGITLNFLPTNNVPDVNKLQVIKADEWPLSTYLKPPALARKQGDELAIYFYYKKSYTQKLDT